jgi:hypothetical protein
VGKGGHNVGTTLGFKVAPASRRGT